MEEQNSISNNFFQIGNSFAYEIRGKFDLDTRTIDAGIVLKLDEDEFDLHEYAYLDGKNVKMRADRITVEFVD